MIRRGFTLIELLVTIVIISLVGGMGLIVYNTMFDKGKTKYYNNLESGILLAVSDYFLDHQDELPIENDVKEVEIKKLIDNRYIGQLKDSKGNACNGGFVYAYRNKNKYEYDVCLICGDDYVSEGKFCGDGSGSSYIHKLHIDITAKDYKGNDYIVTRSYNSTDYTTDTITVTFKMDTGYSNPKRYDVIDTKTNQIKTSCKADESGKCSVFIDKSGTYEVSVYDSETGGEKIAQNQQFNARISRNGPIYTIEGQERIEITKNECSSNIKTKNITFKLIKNNINEEYKKIEYCVKRKENSEECIADSDYQIKDDLNINLDLESGAYILKVRIYDFANEVTQHNYEFDVMYTIDLEYEDDNSKSTYKVVKGQSYDYLSTRYNDIKPLPTTKKAYGIDNMEIRWHLAEEEYSDEKRITGNSLVENSCTYKIKGLMSIPVELPSDWTVYCNSLTYNGTSQALTKGMEHVTFVNKSDKKEAYQTDANEYTIVAKIDSPKYIWKGVWTFDDQPSNGFKCKINKYAIKMSLSPTTGTVDANQETTFTVTPTVINACKGKLTATSANTGNVTISSGGTGNNITSATVVKWKGASYTTDTKINVNYMTSNPNNCINPNQIQYTAKVNRINQTITLSNITKTYNGSSQSASGATTSGNGTISYTYYNGSNCSGNALSSAPVNYRDGGYSVLVTAAQTGQYNQATKCVKYTMNKKDLTITANNQTINYGSSISTGVAYATASGLVSGDSLTGITLTASTSNVPGGTIKPSGATTSKGIGNYNITYNNGTLTINPKQIGSCPKSSAVKIYSTFIQESGITCPEGSVASGDTYAREAGTHTQTCTGTGNYTGSCSVRWYIDHRKVVCPLRPSPLSQDREHYTLQESRLICPGNGIATSSPTYSYNYNTNTYTNTQSCTGARNYTGTCSLSWESKYPKTMDDSENLHWHCTNCSDSISCGVATADQLWHYYDNDGNMAVNKWVYTGSCMNSDDGGSNCGDRGWYYFDNNGYLKIGWFQAPSRNQTTQNNSELHWYYLDNDLNADGSEESSSGVRCAISNSIKTNKLWKGYYFDETGKCSFGKGCN